MSKYELAQSLGQQLLKRNSQIVTAESCTAGLISAAITDISGSSAWFQQGFVTYSNSAKRDVLGVDEALIEAEGAVSEAVVQAMLLGAIRRSGAKFGIAVSGIAGPSGGSTEKPVGTVCLAWGSEQSSETIKCMFGGDREEVREQAVVAALRNCVNWFDDGHSPKYTV